MMPQGAAACAAWRGAVSSLPRPPPVVGVRWMRCPWLPMTPRLTTDPAPQFNEAEREALAILRKAADRATLTRLERSEAKELLEQLLAPFEHRTFRRTESLYSGSPRVAHCRARAIDVLAYAAQGWCEGDPESPPTEAVLGYVLSIFLSARILRRAW